eukprot:68180-Chlamydomonas_euryale.AAC.1
MHRGSTGSWTARSEAPRPAPRIQAGQPRRYGPHHGLAWATSHAGVGHVYRRAQRPALGEPKSHLLLHSGAIAVHAQASRTATRAHAGGLPGQIPSRPLCEKSKPPCEESKPPCADSKQSKPSLLRIPLNRRPFSSPPANAIHPRHEATSPYSFPPPPHHPGVALHEATSAPPSRPPPSGWHNIRLTALPPPRPPPFQVWHYIRGIPSSCVLTANTRRADRKRASRLSAACPRDHPARSFQPPPLCPTRACIPFTPAPSAPLLHRNSRRTAPPCSTGPRPSSARGTRRAE